MERRRIPEGSCLAVVAKLTFWAVVAVFALLCALGFSGCRTKYVVVPEYHEVIVNKHDTLHTRDFIFELDSVFVWKKGDTVWKEKYKILYKDRWRERIVYRDSVKVDSVRVPYPVERELSKWQQAKMKIGVAFMGVMGLLGILGVIRIRRILFKS